MERYIPVMGGYHRCRLRAHPPTFSACRWGTRPRPRGRPSIPRCTIPLTPRRSRRRRFSPRHGWTSIPFIPELTPSRSRSRSSRHSLHDRERAEAAHLSLPANVLCRGSVLPCHLKLFPLRHPVVQWLPWSLLFQDHSWTNLERFTIMQASAALPSQEQAVPQHIPPTFTSGGMAGGPT
jgi:hypothetical protein